MSSPQDLLNLRTLSQTLEESERSAGGEGGIRAPPYATTSVQRGDIVSAGALRRMTLVSHEVMGDNRLVSDDGCVRGEGDS